MIGDRRLLEKNTFVWIDSTSQQDGSNVKDVMSQPLSIVRHGDRVHVHNLKGRREVLDWCWLIAQASEQFCSGTILKLHPLLDGTKVVAQVNVAGGLYSGENLHIGGMQVSTRMPPSCSVLQ